VQRQFTKVKKSRDLLALQVDAKLFSLALRSYPELFLREPNVSFEQHFLSLIVAAQNHPSSTHTVVS
jgi:hypothetical protein